jgi:hypothetical protein
VKVKRPLGTLAWFSAIWFIAGVGAAVLLIPTGNVALGVLSAGVAVLAAGLWLGWRWVRIPFAIYWCIIALAGLLLLIMQGFSIRGLGQVLFAAYSTYLIYDWDPREPEMLLLNLSETSNAK